MTNRAYQINWERIFGKQPYNDEESMKINVDTLIKTATFQKLPVTIQKHLIFNKIKRIKRIFPYIGLKNSLEPCDEIFRDKKTYIGFSSGGISGLWDIATMSMRGVCSCMHWNNSHSKHLIGSITDPFLGIVYLTDKENTPFGISFRKRSLVRLVYNSIGKNYRLLLERPYIDTGNIDPLIYTNRDPNKNHTLDLFKKFLESKVDSKYVVTRHDAYGFDNRTNFIPTSSSVDSISVVERSMSDCSLTYQIPPPNSDNDFISQFSNQT